MVYNKGIAGTKEDYDWSAPVSAYPGEYWSEDMVTGVVRVIIGEEEAKTHTGIPVFQGFEGRF